MLRADDWIARLQMKPHPEGGFYREAYRAAETIRREHLPDRFDGDRAFSTAIYYLLRSGEFGAFHRIRQDEVWHFYDGAPLTLHVISGLGRYATISLGRDPDQGAFPQIVIPAGDLFAAEVEMPGGFALVGCTVAPGFDFRDFEMPNREELLARYPEHRAVIERFSKG